MHGVSGWDQLLQRAILSSDAADGGIRAGAAVRETGQKQITFTKYTRKMENNLKIDFERGMVSLVVTDCPLELADGLMEVNKEMANYMETLRMEVINRRAKAQQNV